MDTTETRESVARSPLSKEDISRIVRAWRRGCQVRFRKYTLVNGETSVHVEVIVDYAEQRSLGSLDEVAAMDEDSLRQLLTAKFAGISK